MEVIAQKTSKLSNARMGCKGTQTGSTPCHRFVRVGNRVEVRRAPLNVQKQGAACARATTSLLSNTPHAVANNYSLRAFG